MHTKKRGLLNMKKAEAMLNVKMTEAYKQASQRASSHQQRHGKVSVAEDLRSLYMHARARAAEKRDLELRLAEMRQDERDEQEQAAEDEGLVTVDDVADVLDEHEQPLLIPDGYEVISITPTADMLDSTNAASDALIGKVIVLRFAHYGWCKGTIISKITDRRRAIGHDRVNFVAKFDIDNGRTTDLSLDAIMYDTSPSAAYESWLLLEKKPEEEEA